MADPAKPEGAAKGDEEKLAHALVSRGLVTRAEAQQCRTGVGAETLLHRLVEAGFLTRPQAQRAAEELPLLLGQQIPGYQLLEKLGQGAMGTVYKARQLSLNRLVAVKVLHGRLAGNPDYLGRLTREARLAAKLSHNNVVQAIDVGQAGNLHYLIMEYVEGRTLQDELRAGKKYAEREAVDVVLQIAQALAHAHRRGLIHRDIKPSNVILTADGIAKLADLGIARETADKALARAEKGLTIGTPYYLSPEQVLGQEDLDVRADIYSLGATFYHLVTGQPPFDGDVDTVLRAHLHQELTPPDHLNTALSSGLGEVVEFMMAKDRRQRYQVPDDLVLDLECLLNGEPPRLARQRIEAATLRGLAEGEADEDDDPPAPDRRLLVGLAVLGAALAVSLLFNVVQFLRR